MSCPGPGTTLKFLAGKFYYTVLYIYVKLNHVSHYFANCIPIHLYTTSRERTLYIEQFWATPAEMQEVGCKPNFVCEAVVTNSPSWNDLKDMSASQIKSMTSWTIVFENVFFPIGSEHRVNYDGVKGDLVYEFSVEKFAWSLQQRQKASKKA